MTIRTTIESLVDLSLNLSGSGDLPYRVHTNKESGHVIKAGKHEHELLDHVAHFPFCSPFHMKRLSAVIIPVNPNTPMKRRRKNPVTYGRLLSFTSESPRSVPPNDESQPLYTLGSPWTPLPQFFQWENSTANKTSSDSDINSAPSQASGNSSRDDLFTNSSTQDTFAAITPPLLPLESQPILLELRRKAGYCTLGTSGLRAYQSPGIPPVAPSAWSECKEKVLKGILGCWAFAFGSHYRHYGLEAG